MYQSFDNAHPQTAADIDAKARRKLLDHKRMEFRRAIEDFVEQRRLQHDLADYPELIAKESVSAARAGSRRSARPSR